MILAVKRIRLWKNQYLVILLGCASTISFEILRLSPIYAQDQDESVTSEAVEIDSDGNIILKSKPATEVASPLSTEPSAPEKPVSTEEIIVDDSVRSTPEEFAGPTRGRIRSRLAQVKTQPQEKSQSVVLLKRGDLIDVLALTADHYRVRYLIDGDFPVEGWVLQESVQLDDVMAKPIEQQTLNPYRPSHKKEVETTSPETTLKELPEIAQLPVGTVHEQKSQSLDLLNKKKTLDSEPPNTLSDEANKQKTSSNSRWSGQFSIGYSRYSESISTLNSNNKRVPFLKYAFEGLGLDLLGQWTYPLQLFRLGLRGRYFFHFYDSEVGDKKLGVAPASVLAQLHEAQLGALIQRKWDFQRFSLEPELEVGASFQLLSLNSLRDTTLNQSVLFGHQKIRAYVRAVARAYLPGDFILEPEISLLLFEKLSEQPVDLLIPAANGSAAEYMRTGVPQGQKFLLTYGGSFVFSLRSLGLADSRLRIYGIMSDQSKKFSGTGNRAGIATREARSSGKMISAGLGYQHTF